MYDRVAGYGLIKHFQNGVWKGKCSLVGAYVSIKEARMKSTQLEVGKSYMLLQRI
jgi:hypothetical protein